MERGRATDTIIVLSSIAEERRREVNPLVADDTQAAPSPDLSPASRGEELRRAASVVLLTPRD
jgi:hypothetical protein